MPVHRLLPRRRRVNVTTYRFLPLDPNLRHATEPLTQNFSVKVQHSNNLSIQRRRRPRGPRSLLCARDGARSHYPPRCSDTLPNLPTRSHHFRFRDPAQLRSRSRLHARLLRPFRRRRRPRPPFRRGSSSASSTRVLRTLGLGQLGHRRVRPSAVRAESGRSSCAPRRVGDEHLGYIGDVNGGDAATVTRCVGSRRTTRAHLRLLRVHQLARNGSDCASNRAHESERAEVAPRRACTSRGELSSCALPE